MTGQKISIPKLSAAELKSRLRIRPVVAFAGRLYFVKPVDPKNHSYLWHTKKDGRAKDLTPIRDITTFHTFGYYGFFKPSVAEVLAQIPEADVPQITAFEIIKQPENATDLNQYRAALNQGFHVATTRLYGKAETK